jgi:MYXO-CTERM domain-containing protein
VVLDGPAAADLLPTSGAVSTATRSAVRARLRRLSAEHAALRPAIEATGAVVTADLERLVNAIQVRVDPRRIGDLEKLPGVVRVDPVTVVTPALGQAVPLIGAPQVWQLSTPIRGQGVRIGILDSGIDYTHADFGGPGTVAAYQQNDPNVIEPGTFPTARVVGGWDFVGDTYDASNASTAIPKPDPDPLDCDHAVSQGQEISGGHGTHVTGIAAGNGVLTNGKAYTGPYDASLDPSAFKVFPGVAPEAQLYALKIFGCTGSTDQLAAALERASDPDQNGDFSDHLDVVNASLGTSYGLGSPAEADVIKNLTKVGTLLVVAAGNDGSAFYSAGSPGVYPEALSVAASASANLLAMTIDAPTSIQGDVAAAEGRFTTRLSKTGPITGTLVYAEPHDACATLTNAAALKGHIALIDRGTCPFLDKFNRAVAAGAVAGVVIDNVDAAQPMTMGGAQQSSVSIPGVLIRKTDGAPILAALSQGVTVTLDAGHRYTGPGSETLASFSSRGPSSSDNLLKPEVSAPGLQIKSAGVGTGSDSRNMSGTSMASPMVTGAAALVRQARPGLSPAGVKAALMNSAAPIDDLSGNGYPISMQGAGLIRVDRAVEEHVTAAGTSTNGSVGLSFGAVITDKPYTDTREITLENHSNSPVDYQASIAVGYALPGVTTDVQPKTFTLAAGATAKATLTLTVDPQALGAPGPDPETPPTISLGNNGDEPRQFLNEASGHVVFTDQNQGAETVRVPYEAVVRGAADQQAGSLTGCAPAAGSDKILQIPIEGSSAYPDPVVTAFQLGDWHQPKTGETDAEALLDLVAIGAATDTATKAPADASVYFGVAIAGQWTTPALGQLSRVAVLIDTNFDKKADYEIAVSPLTRDGPYADVLAATTYDLSTQQATDSVRFVNMVGADTLRTAPFDNSVLVLSTFLHSIGLDASNAHFEYSGLTQSETLVPSGQQTKWIDYDALHPWIDTAQGGIDGQPIYKDGDPVVVHTGKTAAKDLPQVLLLHHMNVQGQRWERVNLAKQVAGLESGNLELVASGPAEASPGSHIALEAKLVNSSKTERAGVTLTGSVTGATLLSATPSQGSCTVAPGLSCDFATMKAGETINVKLDAKAPEQGSSQAELQVKASSTRACETTLDDNQAKVDIALPAAPVASTPVYEPTGGCSGCRVGAETTNPAGAAFTSLMLLMGLGWRRRRR